MYLDIYNVLQFTSGESFMHSKAQMVHRNVMI